MYPYRILGSETHNEVMYIVEKLADSPKFVIFMEVWGRPFPATLILSYC